MNTHHVCLSGRLACSGVNACRYCLNAIREYVLTYVAQGMSLSLPKAQQMFDLYEVAHQQLLQQMSRDPQITQRALDVSRVTTQCPSCFPQLQSHTLPSYGTAVSPVTATPQMIPSEQLGMPPGMLVDPRLMQFL